MYLLSPVLNFSVGGVIWYQGESNTHYPSAYHELQNMLVRHWRRTAGSQFPFYYVQITRFEYKDDSSGIQAALLREMQDRAQDLPNTGMVVITDQKMFDLSREDFWWTNMHTHAAPEAGSPVAIPLFWANDMKKSLTNPMLVLLKIN